MTSPNGAVRAVTYDRAQVRPGIVHLGVGNFHRSHQARYIDRLLRRGDAMDWGIIGVGLLPQDAPMRDAMWAQDCEYTLLERSAAGGDTATRIGSIVDYLYAPDRPEEVLAAMVDPRIRIVSLTITEGGYGISEATGDLDDADPGIAADLEDPDHPRTALGYLVAAFERRRVAGTTPFTVLSCDNVQGNGDMARRAVLAFARRIDARTAAWIADHVAFPNCMVDRITPVTTDADRVHLAERYGVVDRRPVVSEDFTQWVIEDRFAAGRPAFESVGVQFTSDVAPYEKMKLRLLNGAHQAIAHVALPLGHEYVHDAIGDPDVRLLVSRFLEEEAAPTLTPLAGVDFGEYRRVVLDRFGNARIRDTVARLATDAADRLATFVLPTISDVIARGGRGRLGAVVVASWALRLVRGDAPRIGDRRADLLRDAVARQAVRSEGFVDDPEVFGSLAADHVFRTEFSRAFTILSDAMDPRDGLRTAAGAAA